VNTMMDYHTEQFSKVQLLFIAELTTFLLRGIKCEYSMKIGDNLFRHDQPLYVVKEKSVVNFETLKQVMKKCQMGFIDGPTDTRTTS
jgi:hypothetical protein